MQPNNQENTSAHGVTHIKGREFTYTWYIHNFNSLCINDISVDSPNFCTMVEGKIIWYLSMTSCQTNSDFLSIGMVMVESEISAPKKKAHLTISIIDNKGKDQVNIQGSFISKGGDSAGREFSKFVKKDYVKDEKNGLLPNGILTIKCKIFFFDEFVQETQSTSLQKNKSCNCNLKTLFQTKKLSDTILLVGSQKFETHKCILAAQSKVFLAMFEHDMKEKNDNTVNIDDIEPHVIEEMLEFIYCGKTEGFQDASNLLIAADKYEIDDLKSICEDHLIKDMNAENVGKTLILADRYKADVLKKRVIQYIVTNPSEINIEQFKTDVESYSPLLADMLRGLM